MNFETYAHSKGLSLAHFQFTPAYRQNIFPDRAIKCEVVNCFKEKAENLGIEIIAVGFGPDHMHLYIAAWKNYAVPYLAQGFKGYSSRVVRKNHWNRIKSKLWGGKFWTEGYFFETVGVVKHEEMEEYVSEKQVKHWSSKQEFEKVSIMQGQRRLDFYV